MGRHNLEDQLKIVTLWRNIVRSLDDQEGLATIYQVVAEATGENDPVVLERIFAEHPASDLGLDRARVLSSSGTTSH